MILSIDGVTLIFDVKKFSRVYITAPQEIRLKVWILFFPKVKEKKNLHKAHSMTLLQMFI